MSACGETDDGRTHLDDHVLLWALEILVLLNVLRCDRLEHGLLHLIVLRILAMAIKHRRGMHRRIARLGRLLLLERFRDGITGKRIVQPSKVGIGRRILV